MKIYTGYFSNYGKYLKKGLYPISIALSTPLGIKINNLKMLNPTWDILNQYKHGCGNEDIYTSRYNNEILGKLDATDVVNKLNDLSNSQDVILLCYEHPKNFCHRQLVAKWLQNNGYECTEYYFDE